MRAFQLGAVEEEVGSEAFANFVEESSEGVQNQKEHQEVSWVGVLPKLNKILRFLWDLEKVGFEFDVIAEYLLVVGSIGCHAKTKVDWIFENLDCSGGHLLIVIGWCLIEVCQRYFVCDVHIDHRNKSDWKQYWKSKTID